MCTSKRPSKLWWVRQNHCSVFRNFGWRRRRFAINISVHVSGNSVVMWMEGGMSGKWMKPLECNFLIVQKCSFLSSASISLFGFSVLPNPKVLRTTVWEEVFSVYFSKWTESIRNSSTDCFALWKFHQFLVYGAQIKDWRDSAVFGTPVPAWISPIRVVCLELIDSLYIWLEITKNALIPCHGTKFHNNNICIAFWGMLHGIWSCLLWILVKYTFHFLCIIMTRKIKYKELKGQILNIAFVEPFVFMGWLFCFLFSAPS